MDTFCLSLGEHRHCGHQYGYILSISGGASSLWPSIWIHSVYLWGSIVTVAINMDTFCLSLGEHRHCGHQYGYILSISGGASSLWSSIWIHSVYLWGSIVTVAIDMDTFCLSLGEHRHCGHRYGYILSISGGASSLWPSIWIHSVYLWGSIVTVAIDMDTFCLSLGEHRHCGHRYGYILSISGGASSLWPSIWIHSVYLWGSIVTVAINMDTFCLSLGEHRHCGHRYGYILSISGGASSLWPSIWIHSVYLWGSIVTVAIDMDTFCLSLGEHRHCGHQYGYILSISGGASSLWPSIWIHSVYLWGSIVTVAIDMDTFCLSLGEHRHCGHRYGYILSISGEHRHCGHRYGYILSISGEHRHCGHQYGYILSISGGASSLWPSIWIHSVYLWGSIVTVAINMDTFCLSLGEHRHCGHQYGYILSISGGASSLWPSIWIHSVYLWGSIVTVAINMDTFCLSLGEHRHCGHRYGYILSISGGASSLWPSIWIHSVYLWGSIVTVAINMDTFCLSLGEHRHCGHRYGYILSISGGASSLWPSIWIHSVYLWGSIVTVAINMDTFCLSLGEHRHCGHRYVARNMI